MFNIHTYVMLAADALGPNFRPVHPRIWIFFGPATCLGCQEEIILKINPDPASRHSEIRIFPEKTGF